MLKSLELFGFKSFADRTTFDFVPGITGIVGPNGSGKSNVVDAIKWILGDQSAKSLRGKEMTDVIFNGSTGRKPNSLAEATLSFDNSNGFLPIESQEVHIGRRIWRSGDAEYLINRSPARLKDVRELFMGTGAGSAAYCIIEQGRVDQILQANATSRRLVFEEAAGISRYKSRKNEAIRKLERVDQNLLRLTDIVDEVEAQVNSLRSQAAKAAKYREISEELRELWLGLAADDFRRMSTELERADRITQELAGQAEELNGRQQEIDGHLSALDTEIAELDDRLRKVERESAAHREQIASDKATIRHQSARRGELDSELVRLRRQRAIMESRAREVIAEREHNQRVLDRFEGEFARRQEQVQAEETQVRELSARLEAERERIEQCRERLIGCAHKVSAEGQRATGLKSQQQTVRQAKEAAERRCDELNGRIAECRAECDRRKASVSEVENQLSVVEEKNRTIREKQQTLTREQDKNRQTLSELRDQHTAGQARKNVLEDLERRQEGLGIGVKEILSRAETSNYPPWNHVLGSVADLIEVDLEQAALLEVALGSRAQLVVLDDYKPLLDYLNEDACRISGRVGFVALEERHKGTEAQRGKGTEEERHKGTEEEDSAASGLCAFVPLSLCPSLPDLSEHPGVVHRADRLVRSSEKVPWLGERLLCDTWIVDTLETALKLSAGAGRGCRFVTLQGELLSSGSVLYVGTVRSESALVSRKSELRRLKNDLFRLDRQVAEEEHRLANLGSSLTGVDVELETARSEIQELVDRLAGLKSESGEKQRELQRLRRDREDVDEELAGIAAQEEQLGRDLEDAQIQLARAEEDRRTLETEIEAAESDVSLIEDRLQTLERKRTAGQLDLAKQEERLNSLRTSHGRLEREVAQRVQQRDEVERRFEAVEAKRRQIVVETLNTSAVLAELFLTEEALAADTAVLRGEKEQFRGRRATLQKEETGIRQRRNELSDRRHQEEITASDIRHQIATLEERMAEEYQMALTEVVATGASAYRSYLQQREHRRYTAVPGTVDAEETTSPDETSDASLRHREPPEESLFEEVRDEIEVRVNRLRRKRKLMGNVNTDSLQDLDDLEKRYGRLSTQLEDLVEAKATLEEIVRKINAESKRLFTETFQSIREYFQELFRKFFGGGEGDIILEDPEDILECGIDLVARPPGKELRSISLLSGGEKTMTALALLLAIFKSRPSPFCILDEVDASMDEANIDRFIGVLKEFQHSTQFIIVTHRKPTMTVADVLYGVTMEQSGVSKRMSVRFEDVSEDGEFTASSADLPDSPQDEMTDAA